MAKSEPGPKDGALAILRSLFGMMPTKWLVTTAAGVLLAVTAAFGGLRTVDTSVPEVAIGETYTGAGLEITVEGAVLTDNTETGTESTFLTLDIVARNTGTAPREAIDTDGIDEIRISGMDGERPRVDRRDDMAGTVMQPRVEVSLRLSWDVAATAIDAGDEIVVLLPDATEHDGVLVHGTVWDYAGVGAEVHVTVGEGESGA